jgi:beta-galactosidase
VTAQKYITQTLLPYIRKILQTLNELAHQLDPARYTVQAHNRLIDPSLVEITDIIGFNRYYGWYEGTIEDFGKVMDKIHEERPELKILISEYGAGAKRGYHVENPERFDFSEDYQLLFHEGYLKQINERPWIGGSAVWNGCDFASQNKIGNIPRINQKGLLDYKRRPKDTYYFYQSQWTEDPVVYIVSHTWTNRKGVKGEKKRIRVFSNCETVELFLNGRSLGARDKDFVWYVKFREGESELYAKGRKEGITVTDRIRVYYEYTTNSKAQN